MSKVQRLWIISVLLMMTLLFWGCQKGVTTSPEETIKNTLEKAKGYEAELSITFTKNKDRSNIKVEQTYSADGTYKQVIVEPENLKGYTTTCDGQKVYEYNPVSEKTLEVPVHPVKNQLMFGTFIQQFLEDPSLKLEKDTTERKGEYKVQLTIPGNYKYMATKKVWFDPETAKPLKMQIYDKEGQLTIEIEFVSFKYNK